MATYDIVIRNGQVADGTGKKLFAADVAIRRSESVNEMDRAVYTPCAVCTARACCR